MPGIRKLGLLVATAAMQVGVYEKTCRKFEIEVLPVPADVQRQIQSAIFGKNFSFKSDGCTSKHVEETKSVAQYLIEQRVEALMMECTEIHLILGHETFAVPLIDPNEIIVEVAVKYAKNQ